MLVPALILLSTSHASFSADVSTPLLLHDPTLSAKQIAFAFGGDIWTVPKEGGQAVRLTDVGNASQPMFSPNGQEIAFVAGYDGQAHNIYVVAKDGGQPKRLTFEPANDSDPVWTPDGKNILYSSDLLADTDLWRLYEVSVAGGLPKPLPLPSGTRGVISPDGTKIAYEPGFKWQAAWKRYRGGQASKIWIAQLSDSKTHPIPRKGSNDSYPMWEGNDLYFLSDRKGPVSLYRYGANGSVEEALSNESFDFWSASAGPGGIVIEQPGGIELYDIASHSAKRVPISIAGDFKETRVEFKHLGQGDIRGGSISPTGVRAVIEARGNIFTVPAEKGDTRDLTDSSSSDNRMPAWSPDGRYVAYLSDASGEYKLVIAPSDGQGDATDYVLGNSPAYYFNPTWSPDSAKIAYRDNHHCIWILDVKSSENTLVDTNPYENVLWHPRISWSPNSKWITYHRDLDTHISAAFVYDIPNKKLIQLTDGLSDAEFPVFDSGGKYLYFFASTNAAPSEGWLDLSSLGRNNVASNVYCVVLRNDLPSPLAPESDEEPSEPAKDDKPGKDEKPKGDAFRIDLDGISQRILSLPMRPAGYTQLEAGPEDTVFAAYDTPAPQLFLPPHHSLLKFSLSDRKELPFAEGVSAFEVSSNHQKILLVTEQGASIVPTATPPSPGQGALNLDGMTVKVDPKEEWKQIYHEVWRIERDYFYDSHHHGQNLTVLEARYRPFLDGLVTREDLNFLFTEMLGEISVGHMFISGGDMPNTHTVPGGLLGADYALENGRYRLARVYDGENWNPDLYAPLTQPGINGKKGEYILAIDGRNLTSKDNIYERLESTAGKQVRIKIGPNADGIGSREVVIVPIPNEAGLRHLAWVEDNRRTVEKLSGGRLGYVHVPDTSLGGWLSFNRYYYSQIDHDGMVIDERFNHGGSVDDYFVEQMSRKLNSMWTTRYGKDTTGPLMQNFGPKVLLMNEFSGSGGDYFPWHFRQAKIGPLIGKRTWGGLVGILEFPLLRDGGHVTSPNIAFYNPNGTWDVENHGVDPDIDVDLDPYLWRQGHDAQLERGVTEAMKLLEATPKPAIKKPAYMDKSKLPPGG
jgi:tricorn protease